MSVPLMNRNEVLKKKFWKQYRTKSLYALAYGNICLRLRKYVTEYFEQESRYSLAENVSLVVILLGT